MRKALLSILILPLLLGVKPQPGCGEIYVEIPMDSPIMGILAKLDVTSYYQQSGDGECYRRLRSQFFYVSQNIVRLHHLGGNSKYVFHCAGKKWILLFKKLDCDSNYLVKCDFQALLQVYAYHPTEGSDYRSFPNCPGPCHELWPEKSSLNESKK